MKIIPHSKHIFISVLLAFSIILLGAQTQVTESYVIPANVENDWKLMNSEFSYDAVSTFYSVRSLRSSASWTEHPTSEDILYTNDGTDAQNGAILYSNQAFQSDTGFRLTVEYTTGSIEESGDHTFAFGLISNETDLGSYDGFNPFNIDDTVYSVGVNLTADGGTSARGINFTNGAESITLHTSGKRHQFITGETTKIFIEIGGSGFWSLYINDEYEQSGVFVNGFDLSKSYQVAVYGQDDNGGGKSIQSIQLESQYAAGERADNLRGTWTTPHARYNVAQVSHFKTLDSLGISFTTGATASAQHFVPLKLFDILWGGDTDSNGNPINHVAPIWGDLSSDEPDEDPIMDTMLEMRAAGFKIKAYTNSENFVGSNASRFEIFVERWKEWCDTDPEAVAYLNSQPFHTGVWNRTTQAYEDASDSFPNRKYMFCYAEFVLKEHSIRYGPLIDNWTFDDGRTMNQQGDNNTSGIPEEQRIFQAFSNAARAGNPKIATAYNNGRSSVNNSSFPFANPIYFEDFTFGHAFGGNNNHASGNQFNLNYRHITRMIETNGYVHEGSARDYDDLIVGHFHSKVSTTAWCCGPNQAWEQDDFNQWTLEAMQAGGAITWDGSVVRNNPSSLRVFAFNMFQMLDDHLAQFESPETPNWTRAYTVMPDAEIGQPYNHVLEVEIDFWDPEGDEVVEISAFDNAPAWLTITQDPSNSGRWILSGIPDGEPGSLYEFSLQAVDENGHAGSREVEIVVGDEGVTVIPTPTPIVTGFNLALNHPTSQSSTGFGGDSGRAVDGNTSGNYSGGSVTHTDNGTLEEPAWWEVDLGAVKEIDQIRIWGRTNSCCTHRLSDVHIFVSDVPFVETTLSGSQNQVGVTDYFIAGELGIPTTTEIDRSGRYVRVQLTSTEELSLAEVEVFGEAVFTAVTLHGGEAQASGFYIMVAVGVALMATACLIALRTTKSQRVD